MRYTENLPNAPPDDRGLPDLSFAFYDRMVLFDHIRKTILVVAQAHVGPGSDPQAAYETACGRIDELVDRLAAPAPTWGCDDIDTESPVTLKPRSNFTPSRVRSGRASLPGVHQGRRHLSGRSQPAVRDRDQGRPVRHLPRVARGQSQPVSVLSAVWRFRLDRQLARDPGAGRGRDGDDPPAGGYAASRAPTRPRTGHWPKSCWPTPRSDAEHIMLVDLGRNDVGRVADYRTVAAHRRDEGRAVFARHAHHVERDRPAAAGQTAFDALRAGLPAGTVSGAPKVRAMQIIDEVEPQKRGPYGGAVGYIDFTGNMDTCIALRTLVIQGKTAYIQAGGGRGLTIAIRPVSTRKPSTRRGDS